MMWVKDGLEIAGILFGLYLLYCGAMGVSYEVNDWFLTKCGYPDSDAKDLKSANKAIRERDKIIDTLVAKLKQVGVDVVFREKPAD